jgi:hypothetical protein
MTETEWRKWVAQTYGRSVGPITIEAVEMFDSDVVFEGPQATGGTVYQYSMRQGVEQQSDGKWYTKYVLGPIFTGNEEMTAEQQEAEYKTRRDAEQAVSIRTQRNQKLAETDWTQVADAPVDKQAWATYRQVLRDVPTQTGFPWNTQWPNKPE